MRNAMNTCRVLGYTVAAAIVISLLPEAWAGWTGYMNGAAFGQAKATVTSVRGNITNAINTTTRPSAAIAPTTGYNAGVPLPTGASVTTVSRIKGQVGYIWTATTRATNGDKADSADLEFLVSPTTDEATTTLEVTSFGMDTTQCGDGQALYSFDWTWSGSDAGTAQRVQWWEIPGELPEGFDGRFANLPGVIFRGERIAITPDNPHTEDLCGEIEPVPCYGLFGTDHIEFCATADSSKVFMVSDGIAVSQGCALSFTGFLAPIGGADDTGGSCGLPLRQFKLGSTIPVKMKLACNEVPLATGDHTITLVKCDNQTSSGSAIDATPTDAATTGNLFRLTDAAAGEWHFNLSTKGLTAGTWKIIATLSDGSVHNVYVDLKR